jgi:hypothetical protein
MKRTSLMASLLLAAACGGSPKPVTTGGDPGGGGGTGDAPPVDPTLAARQAFENPGGMWMPRQMGEQAALLQGLGLQIEAAALSNPAAPPLSAVVSLGGCTASFVSDQGLVVTNHHCVQGALQLNSTPESNLVENGFLAKTPAEEKNAGPTARVYVAQKMTDVTASMRDGLDAIADAGTRYAEVEKREKGLVAACEQDRPGIKCRVSGFFKGSEYQLIEYLEIRDVRLAYVPHRAVGNYGGEIDNWEWPRHTGDFAFYRAYVGPDGKPADYSPDNVPFRPAAHLKVQPAGVAESDYVMVTGYPGVTRRLQLAAEVTRQRDWSTPRYLEKARQRMELLAELQKAPGETAIKAGVARQNVQNGLEKFEGIQLGLQDGTLIASKEAEEQAFRAWAAQDPSRAGYVEALDAVLAMMATAWERDAAEETWRDAVGGSSLLGQALFFARYAEEQQKPDAERKPGYQDRDRNQIVGSQKTFAKRFDAAIDRAFFTMMLRRAAADPGAAAWLPEFLGARKGAKVDDKLIGKTLDAWYGATRLADEKVRMELLAASPTQLAKSKDPFVTLALSLLPTIKKNEKRDEAWSGDVMMKQPLVMKGMAAFKGGMLAPDANSTLRVSYGTVRGYRPAADKPVYHPFTYATEIPGKNTGTEPFDAPQPVLDAIAKGTWGPYADAAGRLPVNFLSDLDITGGNSGSPVLNARGELIGLAFDGNKEGLASDVVFKGAATRTITCDIRYLLWLADAVDGADHLLKEMGVTPAL